MDSLYDGDLVNTKNHSYVTILLFDRGEVCDKVTVTKLARKWTRTSQIAYLYTWGYQQWYKACAQSSFTPILITGTAVANSDTKM